MYKKSLDNEKSQMKKNILEIHGIDIYINREIY